MAGSKAEGSTVMSVEAYDDEQSKSFDIDPTIPDRFRGTAADKRDMVILGKRQVLRVSV